MYSVYADGVRIYADAFAIEGMQAANPKLTLEDNAAGTLSITLPPGNNGYDKVKRLTTDISVTRDGEEIWSGRVLDEHEDFDRCRTLTCEGALAFFNDTIQPPARYEGLTMRGYLDELLRIHNAKTAENRRFVLGAVTVADDTFPDYYTNYETTMSAIFALQNRYGGHLRVRRKDGVRYLDYLLEYPRTSSQLIRFGENLIEFAKNWDSSDCASVVIPLGKRLEESPIEALDAYLTVESVNSGSIYVHSDEAVDTCGWIEKVVVWDDVDDPDVLLEKARSYLSEQQFDNIELEVSALDLRYMDVKHEAIGLLDEVRVISRPHGLDRLFPVTKLEIPLDSPEQTQFTLGSSARANLTESSRNTSAGILQKIEHLPKAHSILKEAKENATQIMELATTGYITITKDQYGSDTLYISNIRDYTKADKLWKWNMNGLGYSKDGGKSFGLAITMDGSIVADYITTGVLNADVIRTGTLMDYGENFALDFNTGKLTMKKGSISIGEYSPGAYNFTVDEDGNLYARRGTFAGTLLAAKGSFGGVVQAEDYLDAKGQSMLTEGRFAAKYLDLYGLTVRKKDSELVTFAVASDGTVTVNGAVRMGEGSSIDWSAVSNVNLSSNPAYSLASSASSSASGAKQAVEALRSGLGYTYIDGEYVISPNIVGGTIRGGKFYSTDGKGWMEIDSDAYTCGLILKRSNDFPIFELRDGDFGLASLRVLNNDVLGFEDYRNFVVKAYGEWDFSGATVVGL